MMFVRKGKKLGSVLVDKASAEPEPSEAEPEPDKDNEFDVLRLRVEAEALGVKVDGRWGVDRLREEIARFSEDEEPLDGDDNAHA